MLPLLQKHTVYTETSVLSLTQSHRHKKSKGIVNLPVLEERNNSSLGVLEASRGLSPDPL